MWEAFIQQCHIVGLYYLWIITTEGAFGGLSGTELSYRAKEQMYSSHIFIQSFREVPGHFLNVTSLIALYQSNELHSFTTLIFFSSSYDTSNTSAPKDNEHMVIPCPVPLARVLALALSGVTHTESSTLTVPSLQKQARKVLHT